MNPYAPPQASPSTAPGSARLHLSATGIVALAAIAANVTARWSILALDLANMGDIAARRVSPTVVTVERVLGGIEGFTRLGAIILFLVWVHQTARNVRELGRRGLTISPGMCVGWFFVPFANLVMPYQVVSQIAVASDREGRGSAPAFVAAWWGLYLASNFLALARSLMGTASAELGLRLGCSAIADIAAAGSLVALFLTVRFVDSGQRYWASQPRTA